MKKGSKSRRIRCVYIVHCTKTGLHKIGMSHSVEQRMLEMDTVKNVEVITEHDLDLNQATVLHCPSSVARGLELALHEAYKEKRVSGEWFSLTADDVVNIRGNVESSLRLGGLDLCPIKVQIGVSVRKRHKPIPSSGVPPFETVRLRSDTLSQMRKYSELCMAPLGALVGEAVELWTKEKLPNLMKPFDPKD